MLGVKQGQETFTVPFPHRSCFCVAVHSSHIPAGASAGAPRGSTAVAPSVLPAHPAAAAAAATGDAQQHRDHRSAQRAAPQSAVLPCQHAARLLSQTGRVRALPQVQGHVGQQA